MSEKKQMNRRHFLKNSMTGVLGAGILSSTDALHPENRQQEKELKIREYRILGRTGFKVSDIGIGTSFLTNPKVLELALDMGLNYIDTAEHYSRGESERTIGQVLKNRDRKSVFISTKLNLSFGGKSTKENIKERFMKCLERMQTDYADCLMIHMCPVEQVKHEDFHAAVKELKAEGKVHFTGLSSHGLEQRIYGDTKDPMEKVVIAAAEDGRFDAALFVYNFLQKEQGEKIIEACKKKNVGVTLMKTNPVNVYQRIKAAIDRRKEMGGQIPESLKKTMEDYRLYLEKAEDFKEKYGLKNEKDIRSAAIKFVLSHPGVHTVCPSMNSFDELEAFAALSGQKLLAGDTRMLNNYESNLGRLYCRHACGECEPACPYNVPVNTIMRYNHYFEVQGREKHAMTQYHQLTGAKADRCRDCSGACVTACLHHVPIRDLLLNAHWNLTLG